MTRQPHLCKHLDDDLAPDSIEWCVCSLDEDHWHDDVRIMPHKIAIGARGWWQNPVSCTVIGEPR